MGVNPGRQAFDAFARDFDAATPRAAMRAACARLRQRVVQAGWTPGLEAYLRAFGLPVLEASIPTAGRLDYEAGRYVIRVQRVADGDAPRPPLPLRPADATGRQRFSIAHEIGHALLLESLGRHPDYLPGLADPAIWPDLERLCDQAAADLLVPLDDFLRAVAQIGCSPRSIERLSDGFRVSSDVVLLRFLAAGARSVSLWQVRPDVDRHGALAASVVRSYRSGRAPGLDPGTPSGALSPDVVLQVVCGGRAHTPTIQIASSKSSPYHLAAIADGGPVKETPFEPAQLSWLGDEATDTPARSLVGRPGLEAHVTLLLLPEQPDAPGPLWAALIRTSDAAPR